MRQINRRSAWVLPVAAVALATVMAAIAVKPVVLGLLGIVALIYGLPALGVIVVAVDRHRRRLTDGGQPTSTR